MSQQPLDVRRSIQIVRRHRVLFVAAVVLGLLIGAGYTVLRQPMSTATALVVLPQAAAQQSPVSNTPPNTAVTDIPTQVVIATSNPVLSAALPHVSPAMSLQALQNKVQVKGLTQNIISISATGKTAAQAQTTANAVARSYIDYVSAKSSPVGRVPVALLEPATTATKPKLPERVALYALLGALAGALVGFIISLAIGRNDRGLRERDSIANSIGIPVLASLPAEHPSGAVGWARLLAGYEPGVLYAWRLRAVLEQLGLDVTGPADGHRRARSVTVLSFASDPGALALGPQLASFAASLGISTALIIGPQQDPNAAAALRTAAAAGISPSASERTQRLLVSVRDDGDASVPQGPALVVVVAVVDGRTPRVPDTLRTDATVLAVSAGAASAEQLARAATAAAVDGREILGIFVANPERGDQSTGRLPRLTLRRPALPTRVVDVPTEIGR